MYCIAILTDQEQEGQKSAEYIRNYCTEKHVFPLIEIYQKQEQFFAQTLKTVPTVVFLALPGVSGLNAAEHLRSLYPKCGIIWCSDLDFSLHAFRLRVEYFFREPLNEKMFEEGMDVWLERRKAFQEQGALQHRADRKTMGSNENRWSHFMKDQ